MPMLDSPLGKLTADGVPAWAIILLSFLAIITPQLFAFWLKSYRPPADVAAAKASRHALETRHDRESKESEAAVLAAERKAAREDLWQYIAQLEKEQQRQQERIEKQQQRIDRQDERVNELEAVNRSLRITEAEQSQRVSRLVRRVDVLEHMLREAHIPIPNDYGDPAPA